MTLSQDIADNSPLLLSAYGLHLALGFKGSPDFIRRCYNWAINHGIAKGDLHWPFDKTGRLAYILVENREVIELR